MRNVLEVTEQGEKQGQVPASAWLKPDSRNAQLARPMLAKYLPTEIQFLLLISKINVCFTFVIVKFLMTVEKSAFVQGLEM